MRITYKYLKEVCQNKANITGCNIKIYAAYGAYAVHERINV